MPLLVCLLALGTSLPAFGNPGDLRKASLVLSGTIVGREEIWDRRSNPLMGRPDFLKEIRLEIACRLPAGKSQITASIQGQESLLAYKFLATGMSGKFYLSGQNMPYELLAAESVVKAEASPETLSRPRPQASPAKNLNSPENSSGRDLKASALLRKKAIRVISARYGMRDARMVFLTSFQGPRPPEGGYVYWGVTGRIKGRWHIWQQGELRQGSELEDPKRYQK